MFLEYYLMGIILLPGIILGIYAQIKVMRVYNAMKNKHASSGITGAEFAKKILDAKNIKNVAIKKVGGDMTDNYNPKNRTLNLSANSYNDDNLAALGITAHEVGHALQHADNYKPLKFRNFLVPVSNFTSRLLWPLIIIGILFFGIMPGTILGDVFLWLGVGMFGLSAIISLITLPVEINASKRAKKLLSVTNILTEEECESAGAVLDAAALTYVAALLIAILNLLRYVTFFRRRY